MLNTSKMAMTWLCMVPADQTSNKWQRIAYFLVTFCELTCNASCVAAYGAFVVKYLNIDLNKSLFALMAVIGLSGTVYIGISGILLRHKMIKIYKQLSDIYDTVKSTCLMNLMTKADATCEWICKYYILFVKSSFFMHPTLALISVFVCWWFNGDFMVDHFYHPILVILPWNQTTYFGYTGEILYASIGFMCYDSTVGTVLLFFISMCIHHQTFFEMFTHLIEQLNECTRTQRTEAKICEIIRFRSSVQTLFSESTKVYSSFMMTQLISCGTMLTISVFYLDTQLEHVDSGLALLVMSVSAGILIIFLCCYFGVLATESYENMADSLYQSNWPDLLVTLQKYIVVMIVDMQKPIRYHGFGIANLDLKTFISFIKSACSYYMILKSVASK